MMQQQLDRIEHKIDSIICVLHVVLPLVDNYGCRHKKVYEEMVAWHITGKIAEKEDSQLCKMREYLESLFEADKGFVK